MNKKSVMKSFQPHFYNGVHQVWNENFKFDITFANGDTGVGMSKKPQGNWTIGSEYNYEWKQGKYGVEFRGIKDANATPYTPGQGSYSGGGKKYEKNPEEQKTIINQVALMCVNVTMNKLQDELSVIYLAYKNWMYDKIFNSNEPPITVQGVLKIACQHEADKLIPETTLQQILKMADAFLKTVKNTSWNNPLAQQNNSQPFAPSVQQPTPPSPPPPQVEPPQSYQQRPPEDVNPFTM